MSASGPSGPLVSLSDGIPERLKKNINFSKSSDNEKACKINQHHFISVTLWTITNIISHNNPGSISLNQITSRGQKNHFYMYIGQQNSLNVLGSGRSR